MKRKLGANGHNFNMWLKGKTQRIWPISVTVRANIQHTCTIKLPTCC